MKRLNIILLIIILFLVSCVQNTRINAAKKKADFIINSLDQSDVIKYFPQTKFDSGIVKSFIKKNIGNCNWKAKKLIKFSTQNIDINSTKEVNFIYDYLIDCGEFRFSLSFNLDEQNPLFHYFLIQPILPIN